MVLPDKLKVSIIQADIIPNSPAENRRKLEYIIKTLTGTDLVILPEMFTTGFHFEGTENFEESDGETFTWMLRLAKEYDMAIGGSVGTVENGKFFNRFALANENDEIGFYDKMNLFPLSDEAEVFTPGDKYQVFDFKGWKILPQICYDLRFPIRRETSGNFDIAIYTANWPAQRIAHWEILLKGRAVENQAYVLGCNRVGADLNNVDYNGNSMIIGPAGRVFESAFARESVLEYTLDPQYLNEIRTSMPFTVEA